MRVLVVFCHPLRDSFVGAVLDRAVDGLATGGHDVRVLDLYRASPDGDGGERDLDRCEALVLIYPTWWSGQPALLTQWLQQVFAERHALRNVRRLVAVSSHGSPRWTNVLEGESGKRFVARALRLRCSRRCRTRWIPLFGLDHSTDEDRARMLDRVERRLSRARL